MVLYEEKLVREM